MGSRGEFAGGSKCNFLINALVSWRTRIVLARQKLDLCCLDGKENPVDAGFFAVTAGEGRMEHVMPVTAGMGSGHPADEFGVNPGSLPTEDEESFKEAYKKAISPTNWAVQTQPRHILVNRKKGDTFAMYQGVGFSPLPEMPEFMVDDDFRNAVQGAKTAKKRFVWDLANGLPEKMSEVAAITDRPVFIVPQEDEGKNQTEPIYFPGFTEAELKAMINQNKGQ